MSRLHLPQLGMTADAPFPPTAQALAHPNGLLAWGGDLHPRRLLSAYRKGIFPWYTDDEPILWWTPDPRCVLYPGRVHLSRRTRRRYNAGTYRLTADTAFGAVVAGCAAPREHIVEEADAVADAEAGAGTWITAELKTAFESLHRQGHAHSVEVWRDKDAKDMGRDTGGSSRRELVGGIYGLALGRVFFGESMFSRATDASKIALVALCRQLEAWGFALLDCQVTNPHLLSMGAVEVPRREFERQIAAGQAQPGVPGPWTDSFAVGERW